MSRAAFPPVLLRLSIIRHIGHTLHPVLFARKLTCPTTYSVPIHTDTQKTLTDVPEHKTAEMASVGTRIVGKFGSRYVIERLLQEKKTPDIRVYLAKFVIPLPWASLNMFN